MTWFKQRYSFLQAAFIVSCFFVISCENDIREVNEFMKKQTGIEEGLNVNIYMSQDGVMKARLTAPYMLRYLADPDKPSDTAYVEFPKTLHVDFYDDSSKIESTLDALYARYRENEGKVFLKDSVVVINLLKGDTLRTNELWWDQNTKEFYTDKPVRIHQPDKTIYGRGLRAAQDFSSYDIYHPTGTVLTTGEGLGE